jgi:WD40 repeat protein
MLVFRQLIGAAVALGLVTFWAAIPALGRGEPPQAPTPDSRPADRETRSLPERVIARLGSDRLRRPELFTSVAYSPDGSTLASASRFGTVRLWDAADGSERTLLQADKGGSLVVFSPDGKWLAASGNMGGGLWELRKGQAPRPASADFGGDDLAFSSDGRLLASGSRGGVSVWDMAAGKVLFDTRAEGGVGAVAFSPDGKLLASAADISAINHATADPGIRLRDTSSGKVMATLEGHKDCVLSLAFAPDGKTLASSSLDASIRIWDVAKRETIRRIDNPAHRIAFSPDGKKLATACTYNGKIRFFDPSSGELLLEIQDVQDVLKSLSFSPDGKMLAVAGGSSTIRLWDTTTGKAALSFEGHQDAVANVAFSPNGKRLASWGGDRSVRLWDLGTRKEERTFSIGPGQFFGHDLGDCYWCLAFTPDGKQVAAIGSTLHHIDPPNVYLWDIASGDSKSTFSEPDPTMPFSIAVAPDGDTLAVCGAHGVRLWSLSSGRQQGLIPREGDMKSRPLERCAVFLPDGKTLATVRDDRTIRLLDWRQGKLVRSFSIGTFSTFVAASPEGSLLATCGPVDGYKDAAPVYVWETATGKLLRKIGDPKDGDARCVSFAADGRRLVVATKASVDVWDVFTGEELSARDGKPVLSGGHKGAILCAAISPDGKTIASGSADTTILLWNAADLQPKTPVADLGPKVLDRLWDDLRSDDAPTAYKAILALLSAPEKATGLIKNRVPPAQNPDPKHVQSLVTDLDDNDVSVREAASKGLGRLGEAIEPALRETLAATQSAEVRSRCERLLEALGKGELDADGLRRLRAVQVLEHIGSAEARAVLKGLAGGAPGRLSREAKLALDVLDRRTP